MTVMADDKEIGDSVDCDQRSPKSQEIVDDLKAWCDQEVGREALAGKVIGVDSKTVKNWFLGEQQPTSDQIILVQQFLAKQENWKKSA
jgi:hypothetical protein